MISPKHTNFMTTIKLQLEEKNKRKYSNNKQQKNMQYYNLFINKIIAIQRWYRNCLVKQNRKMEKMILLGLRKRQHLHKLNQYKAQELQSVKIKRSFLLEEKQNQFIQMLQNQIAEKVKKALKGTLNSADRLASNNGQVKYVLQEIKQCQTRGEQLQGEVQALKFQYGCHRKRKAEWQEKLFKIKQNILNETLKTKDIKTKINQMKKPDENVKFAQSQ